MARKRQKLRHLDYRSQEYWNRLLAQDKLSLSQGENPKLVYSADLEKLEEITTGDRTGRIRPHLPLD
jgi:hypothetical protein